MTSDLSRLQQRHKRLDEAFDMFTWEMCDSFGDNKQLKYFEAQHTTAEGRRLPRSQIVGRVQFRGKLVNVHVSSACPVRTWKKRLPGSTLHNSRGLQFTTPTQLYGRRNDSMTSAWSERDLDHFCEVAFPRSLDSRIRPSDRNVDCGTMKDFRAYHAIIEYDTTDSRQQSSVALKQVVWDPQQAAFVRDLKRIERGDPELANLTFYHYESITRDNTGVEEYVDYSAIICSTIVEDTPKNWRPWRAGDTVILPFPLSIDESPELGFSSRTSHLRSSTPSAAVPHHLQSIPSFTDNFGDRPPFLQPQIPRSPIHNKHFRSLGHRSRSHILTNRQSKVYHQETVGL